MNIFSFIFIFVFFANNCLAQKADFEAAEKFNSKNIEKMTGSIQVSPNWLKKSDKFWYSFKTREGKKYYIIDPFQKSKKTLFDNENMAEQLTLLTHKPYNNKDLPIGKIEFNKTNNSFTMEIDSIRFEFDLLTSKLTLKDTVKKEPEKMSWKEYSPDSTYIVFSKAHNLYLMKTNDKDSVEIQLTTDGELFYSYNSDDKDTSTTKRLRSRADWFKDSKKIYMVKSDNRKVEDLFVINSLSKPRPKLETYKYAMPGEKNVPQYELIIFDVASKKRVNVETKKWKDQTISPYTTSKGSDKLFFIRKARTKDRLDICVVNTDTGSVKQLISEESKPYFNDQYNQLMILNEGKDIIWWSERTGWGQLYLYDGDGNLKNRITSGNYVVGSVTKIDTNKRVIYFQGFGRETGVDPYYSIYYKVNFDGGGLKLLTPEDANHSMDMAESYKYFVDNYSRVDQIPKSVLRDNEGKILLDLEKMDMTRLNESGWRMPETFMVKADDGVTDLYGVMWKPFNFDSSKKYPIISYVYPGPQTESVPKSFTVSARYNVSLAQLGFIVISVGHRGGSPQRDKYYHTFGYNNLRDYPLADDKTAIEQLSDRFKFIDIKRVGIFGHSGGGFMSTAAMFSYPDFYKAAVSSAGNHDNNIYNIWWGETHDGVKEVVKKKIKNDDKEKSGKKDSLEIKNDKPEDDEEITFVSKISDNQEIAKNLKGHLLLVTGDIDDNVHPGNSLRVVDALIKANKRFDFMMIPGQRHAFGEASTYFERMLWYHFAEHLLDDHRNNIDLYDYKAIK